MESYFRKLARKEPALWGIEDIYDSDDIARLSLDARRLLEMDIRVVEFPDDSVRLLIRENATICGADLVGVLLDMDRQISKAQICRQIAAALRYYQAIAWLRIGNSSGTSNN